MNLANLKWPGQLFATTMLASIMVATVVLSACSGNLREVLGEPPQLFLHGLARDSETVIVQLALRNVNDAPLSLAAARLTFELDGRPLVEGDNDLELAISARGREVIRFNLPADPAGLERLDALASGSVQRLPWAMKVKLSLDSGGDRRTRAEGWLHRVPGQENQFR